MVQVLQQLLDFTTNNGYTTCDKKMIDRAHKRKTKQQSPEIIMSPPKGRLRTAFPSTSAETELPVCFFQFVML